MNLRIWVLLLLGYLLGTGYPIHAQVTSTQNAYYIAELEAAQSKITQTFVSCSMRRLKHHYTKGEHILIHRSDDHTATWNLVKTLSPTTHQRYIDPVMTVDEAGNFYVVFMRIAHANKPLLERFTALDLYRSTDDGITWQFVGTPYQGFFPDYPQIISTGNGQLFMAFADFTDYATSVLRFMTSTNGGDSWSTPMGFPFPDNAPDGGGLEDLQWGYDSTLLLSFGNSEFKGPCVTKSFDKGLTWTDYQCTNQTISNAMTAVLSKIVAHPQVDFYGIFTHRPHFANTPMTFHFEKNNELGTLAMGNGSYAETILTPDSIIHYVYNSVINDTFQVIYRASANQGMTFTKPLVLYQGVNQITERGEYQSLILGPDSLFYLTFCDGSDSSMAKTLVFPPMQLAYSPIPVHSPSLSVSRAYPIYPNPVGEVLHLNSPNPSHVQKAWITASNGGIISNLKISTELESISVSYLSPGMYYLHITESNRTLILPFVKS